MESLWKSELIEANITCIKVFDDDGVFFVGNGNSVEQYRLKDGAQLPSRIKEGLSEGVAIHGIKRFSKGYIIFGGRELRGIESSSGTSLFKLKLHDWIMDVVELNDDIVILTMTHTLIKFSQDNVQKYAIFRSEEKCSLYSGLLVVMPNGSVLVFAGTAFREILIWDCDFLNSTVDYPLVQKLLGHSGVIFSLAQSSNRTLVSTSDDRTARLWETSDNWENVSLVSVLDGCHSSRIFRSVIHGDYVLLGGEDGCVSIWDKYSGDLLKTYEGYSASVWGLDVGEQEIVASSGVSLNIWPFSFEDNYNEHIQTLSFEKKNDFVKELIYTPGRSDLIYLTQCGSIQFNDTLLFSDKSLEGYGIMKINGSSLFVSNLHGEVFAFNLQTRELNQRAKLFDGKIFSLECLSNGQILCCGPKGAIGIYNSLLERVSEFSIPYENIKEWWLTCACSLENDLLVLGNRDGTLFLAKEGVLCTYYRLHGKQGVGDVTYKDGVLRSIGRDGTLRLFALGNDNELIPLNIIKLNYSWMERILHCQQNGLRLLAFYSKYFIVYDLENDKILYQVPCGGCHRSWDFKLEEENESFGTFSYIKDRAVHHVKLLKNSNYSLVKPSYHTKEINALKIISFDQTTFHLLTGGEDTKLSLRNLNDSRANTSGINSHISNVRCIDGIRDDGDDSMILVSGGGRAELKLWRMFSNSNVLLLCTFLLKGNDKRRKKVWKENKLISDVETRITSVTFLPPSHEKKFVIAIACSDGVLRLLSFDKDNSRLGVLCESSESPACLLVVKILHLKQGFRILTGCTKGQLCAWTLEVGSLRLVSKIQAHQSGINAIDVSGSFIATGGDDGALAQFEFRDDVFHLMCSVPEAHESQVTGVKFFKKDLLLSSGVDQKFITWKSLELKPICRRVMSVGDAKGIDIANDRIVIVGEGLQIFKFLGNL